MPSVRVPLFSCPPRTIPQLLPSLCTSQALPKKFLEELESLKPLQKDNTRANNVNFSEEPVAATPPPAASAPDVPPSSSTPTTPIPPTPASNLVDDHDEDDEDDDDDEPPPLSSLASQVEAARQTSARSSAPTSASASASSSTPHVASVTVKGTSSGTGTASIPGTKQPAKAAPASGPRGSTVKKEGVKRGFFDAKPKAKARTPAKEAEIPYLKAQAKPSGPKGSCHIYIYIVVDLDVELLVGEV